MILSLQSDEVPVTQGGGKAATLARLVGGGFPIPPGYVVTTGAYRQFLHANQMGEWLLRTEQSAIDASPVALEEVSERIRSKFATGAIPPALAAAILDVYARMGMPALAVRSSATTEDMPELSFAGQHDTVLNVVGGPALLDATVRCWSSLWTARAIGYRLRNGIAHSEAELAVVIQAMVESETAGVLFTANPLTGKRTETVIDASFGLGEALVSGMVEPDHYVVEALTGRVLSKTLGAKAVAIHGHPGGGTTRASIDGATRQALTDETIAELSALGRRVGQFFGSPQDIEWARADGHISLLQSRPITSLYPMPAGMEPEPAGVFVSLGAIQGMLDPFTPLGRDVFRHGAALASSAMGPEATPQTQRALVVAGERLFINATGAARNARARRVLHKALGLVDPSAGYVLECLCDDPRFAPVRWRPTWRAFSALAPIAMRILGNACYNLAWPNAGRRRIQRRIESEVSAFQQRSAATNTLAERLALVDAMVFSVRGFGPVIMPGLAVGLGMLRFLQALAADVPGAEQAVLETTRGLPHNVTTEMDLALWQVAVAISADTAAAAHMRGTDADTVARDLLSGTLPAVAQDAVDAFLRRFGARGVAEIDIGRSRWREDPQLLVQALQSYLQINSDHGAPDVVFARGEASAAAAIDSLVSGVRRTRFGSLKAPLVRWAARRARALAGLRESPKFTAVRLLGILRDNLLASGRELVATGDLALPNDIFFLELEQLTALARGDRRNWHELVVLNRAAWKREKGRRQVPRVFLSDGEAFFGGVGEPAGEAGDQLTGTPVSAGVVEGTVRVVFEPHTAQLAPGEILVCPGTDPAWTPLFLAAGGLVMEVGGLMTHGSVVAREYGIPAVVGVHQATARLRTGQRVRVDGARGTISILS